MEIKSPDIGFMLDLPATMGEVSRQLWAPLGGLVKNHADTKRLFANVPRHNGFEAWRRIAEPINDHKALVRKDLPPKVTNPRKVTGLDDLPKALEDWEINKRLYTASGGVLPEESQERLAFIEMLPADINVYITMHMDLEEHKTLQALKRFTLKYVKVLQNLKRKPGVPLVGDGGVGGSAGDGGVAGDGGEGKADDDF